MLNILSLLLIEFISDLSSCLCPVFYSSDRETSVRLHEHREARRCAASCPNPDSRFSASRKQSSALVLSKLSHTTLNPHHLPFQYNHESSHPAPTPKIKVHTHTHICSNVEMNILFVQRQIKKRDIVKNNYLTKQQLKISLLQLLTHQEERILVQYFSVFSDNSAWSGLVCVRARSGTNASLLFLFPAFGDVLIPALEKNSENKVTSLRHRHAV